MRPISISVALAAALVVAASAMGKPTGAGPSHSRSETVPLQVKDEKVAAMQQRLDDQGYDAGAVDGLWGPNTAAALRRYQAKSGLQQTGQLDLKTLAALGITGTAAAAPITQAQATPPMPTTSTVAPVAGAPMGTSGVANASGNSNQAVATTSANAPQPAIGANSFTAAEARGRIEREGYTQVSDLHKDGNGVWRGHGMKGANSVNMWLDYKGNIGQQ